MANNINGNAPNAVVAKQTISFVDAGITALNTDIVYLVDDPLLSFVPGRAINGISGFVANKGYYLVAKLDMDLTGVVVPPVSSLTQLAAPGSFAAAAASDTQINVSWAVVPNATGYVVDRATNVGFTTGVTLAIYSGSGTSYNDTGRTASTQYFYRIRATAAGYVDSNYSTANATTNATGAVLENLAFSPFVNLANVGTTWNCTNVGTLYDGYGQCTKKLAAGADGYIQARHVDSASNANIIAFNTTQENIKYQTPPGTLPSHYEAGAFVAAGTLYQIDNGAGAASTGYSIADGTYWRINRAGSVLKLQTSPDATTWTDRYTFTFSSTAALYININIDALTGTNKLYEPKGFNLVTA
jgi:hypothetical protein